MLKSGSNGVHGSFYEYNKVSKVVARETFSSTKPVTTSNQGVGGTVARVVQLGLKVSF